MLSRSLPLFKTFGIQVKVHWSWLILGFLVASSLAMGWFPTLAPEHGNGAYWAAGVLGAIGLFLSIVIHEFSHALVGRSHQMPISNITLFLFGGVAQMEDEPPNPKAEFQMAIAGPLASVALAFIFLGLYRWSAQVEGSSLLQATLSYLASINIVVAVFNMLPGFPLDGGRVLRSILWYIKNDIVWATRIASGIGQLFGWLLMILGVVSLLVGQAASAIWSFLLGLLLMTFARSSYVQLVVKQTLHGKPATTFMDPTPLTVSPETPVSDLMRGFLNRSEQSIYPVISEDQEFLGCVDLSKARSMPEEEWNRHSVREIVQACEKDLQITPEEDAETALTRMSKSGHKELVVVRENRLIGILRQAAIIRYLSLREV